MPLPPPSIRFNPSFSSSVKRKNILSATPQQKFSNFNTLSCNSKYAVMSERKHQPDTRPLADSAYHQSCINQILNFCSKNNYTIRKEQLNFMSTSEMEKLFSFTLSFYEIKIKQNCLDIEIPKAMESLCYPYHINKTSLRSYATPKSKGVVLSMLIFLIEPLMLQRNSIFSNKDDYNLENLKLILNRDQEEKDNFIKQRMNQQLKKKNELESLIKKTEELRKESHSYDNQEDQLKIMRDNNTQLEQQLNEFRMYEQELMNYVDSSISENNELRNKIQETELEIKLLNENKLELENKIKKQERSVDEMNYYIQRDKQVQIEIHKLNDELKKARQEFYQEKLKQDELFDNLKELFFKLTTMIRQFKTELPNAKTLKECLENDKYQQLIVFLNNPDFEKEKFNLELYTDFLKSLKQSINKDLLQCKEEICKYQCDLESNLDRIKKLEKKNETTIEQKQNIIDELEQNRLNLINQIKIKKSEVEKIKIEINAIDADVKLKRKMAINENLEIKNKCEETKKEFNNYWASIKNKTVNLESQLKTIIPIYKEFDMERQKAKLLNAKLNDHLNEEKNAIEKLMNDVIIN